MDFLLYWAGQYVVNINVFCLFLDQLGKNGLKTHCYSVVECWSLIHINFFVQYEIFVKNSGYPTWHKSVTPNDHIAYASKE